MIRVNRDTTILRSYGFTFYPPNSQDGTRWTLFVRCGGFMYCIRPKQ